MLGTFTLFFVSTVIISMTSNVPVAHATGDFVKFVGGRLPTQINSKDYVRYSTDDSFDSTCFDPIQVRKRRQSHSSARAEQDAKEDSSSTKLAKEQHGSSIVTDSFMNVQAVLDSERSSLGRSERLDGPRTTKESRRLYPMRRRTQGNQNALDDPVVLANIQTLQQLNGDADFRDRSIQSDERQTGRAGAVNDINSSHEPKNSKEAIAPCLKRHGDRQWHSSISPWWIILISGLVICLVAYLLRQK